MAPIPSPNRLASASRSRPSASRPRGRPPNSSRPSTANGTPVPLPKKKLRYVPGGPGGGGRYVDDDGNETPVGGTGPGGYNYTGPRGRVGRENAANGMTPKTYPRRRERPRTRTATTPRFKSAAAAAAAVVQGDGNKPREERGWEEFHPQLDLEMALEVCPAEEMNGAASTPVAESVTALKDSAHMLKPAESAMASALTETSGNDTLNDEVRNGHVYTASPTPGAMNGVDSPSAQLTNGDLSRQLATLDETSDSKVTNGMDDTSSVNGTKGMNGMNGINGKLITPRRGRGRPPGRRDSSRNGGNSTPRLPKRIRPPGANARERLTLPKPSFRKIDPFASFEEMRNGQPRVFGDVMTSVGYQENDYYARPDLKLVRVSEGTIEEDLDLGPGFTSEGENAVALGSGKVGTVEYDMDLQDDKWLEAYNATRREAGVEDISREVFEITMTKIEKEWHALEKRIPKPNPKPPQTHRPRSSSAAAVNGEQTGASGEEQDSKCAICDDGDCENTNAIVFCDGCDLAVHQECYGVPFIPEGQWLCRKCQLIGRGTPTCIFCPNMDGAFKQTNSSRWAHLLCSIWIPEVSLGNPTFQEPVMDVEKVPKQRWKLTCYICRQRMGACIQCSNKNCFIAFHVTCARKARLFLKMKSASGTAANFDSSQLKAYCDRHVPVDWGRDNDTEAAITDAQDFYRHTMRNRLWADSQQAACSVIPSQTPLVPDEQQDGNENPVPRLSLVVGGHKRKRSEPRTVWRLPSGAPVIPQVLFSSVESSLGRFGIVNREEYIAEACKFWTLKREARRGAALLKRLQLQMETFSSMEITRRDFVAMGAAGRARLQRRLEFAEQLLLDVEQLRNLTKLVREREEEKVKSAETLRETVELILHMEDDGSGDEDRQLLAEVLWH